LTPPPRFFLDRSLGARSIANGLRAGGLIVQTIEDRYRRELAEQTPDPTWIQDAAQDGYVLLHADKKIRRRTIERDALVTNNARSFAMSSNQLGGSLVVARLLSFRERIYDVIDRRPGPFFYLVYPDKVESRPLEWDSRRRSDPADPSWG